MLGFIEKRIIKYLLDNPRKSNFDISIAFMFKSESQAYATTNRLEKKGYLTKERINDGVFQKSLWFLTEKGINQANILKSDNDFIRKEKNYDISKIEDKMLNTSRIAEETLNQIANDIQKVLALIRITYKDHPNCFIPMPSELTNLILENIELNAKDKTHYAEYLACKSISHLEEKN